MVENSDPAYSRNPGEMCHEEGQMCDETGCAIMFCHLGIVGAVPGLVCTILGSTTGNMKLLYIGVGLLCGGAVLMLCGGSCLNDVRE